MERDLAVGRRLRLVTPGVAPVEDGRVVVVMGPGAFGSGEHETTASCLEVLESLPGLPATSVLDLGSGTGILAIAAVLLGAARAVCVDNDPGAVAAARGYCELNRVGDRVEHVLGEAASAPPGPFGVIVANLHGPVLLAVASELVARAGPGAPVVLSGVLWEDAWEVSEHYRRAGCVLRRQLVLDEYVTFLLTAPG